MALYKRKKPYPDYSEKMGDDDKRYQDYLKKMKSGGKASHKRSKTYAEWKQSGPREKQIAEGEASSY